MNPINSPSYGLWFMVIINSAIFLIFAFSFTRPKTKRDWRSFSAFSAFVVALFAEMYGFPLTIFLLSGWLTKRYPGIDIYSHNEGHLWDTIFNWKGDPHLNFLHILSGIAIAAGFIIIAKSWKILYTAQAKHILATEGPYAKIRHPQYVGFVLVMIGFLMQWPTLLTLLMFPILIAMYVHLAKVEEKEMLQEFGEPYQQYLDRTPRFWPKTRKA
ncbi:MAG: isoprenylcysteine carboxylmethyltransferase family protein [Candidatus Doudnabacteria bacterium]|jgi:protein-S-isoprenylcysteine O-methyltransferase Ste14